ncbi:radical SAM domain-containing protein [Clostridium putrefaciens]|uniref:Radical SAM domain-containing protein n=1 Tax=Clostridium putrefaciens TaxID=99675 RepID=A0A381J5X2_9CLOT|nr:radical SAM protein [Clostridium putrefaciens]SUY45039.1 radical SAM domain-containing protein [Clostridium putrefaciens]
MVIAPFQVDFDITLDCMYKCRHCNVDAGDKLKDEMTTKEILRIIDQMDEIGISDISLTGGEPLLRADALEIIKYAYDKPGVRLTLNTNGLLVDEEKIKFFKENCPNINIAVSLDGYDTKSYSILRKSKKCPDKILDEEFEIVINNLKLIVKSGLSVGINYTLTEPTLNNFWDTYDFITSLGIKSILAIKFFPYGQGRIHEKQLELSYERWKEFLMDATKKKMNDSHFRGVQISVPCPWEMYIPLLENGYSIDDVHKIWDYNSPLESEFYKKHRDIGCHAGITSCAISPNGDLYPCGTISSKFPPFVCGNLKRQSFEDIWYNSVVLNNLRSLRAKNLKGECTTCDYLELCGGGCRARAYTKTGDLYEKDYLCPLHCK